jgi:multidrug efflux pump subunit AcrB
MNRAISWMIRNGVTTNLLMIFILVGGVLGARSLRKQVFPEFSPDIISVSVPYPGATPVEVEESIILPIEARLESLDEIEEITARASQNLGIVTARLRSGVDKPQVLDEVKSAVDRITTFPQQIERPVVTLASPRSQVVQLVLYGDVSELALKRLAKQVRDELVALSGVSDAQVQGVRPYEISIEVERDVLEAFGLSTGDLATIIRRESLDLSGGDIETTAGRVLLRTEGKNETAPQFREIVVLTQPDGTEVRLEDLATVRDGFADSDLANAFNGSPAAVVAVYRVGEESVLDVANAVKAYVAELEGALPAGVSTALWQDNSEVLAGRLGLLIKNGIIGLLLVLVALTLFLELRLAIWVAVGIGISFIGAFGLLAPLGVTINVISLFGFILATGIVVDDAIVMGENIFAERERGALPRVAAERGAQRIGRPVVFAVLTTVVGFSPLLFISGAFGPLLRDLPLVVITVLMLSLVDALFILPMHLSHAPTIDPSRRGRILHLLDAARQRVDAGLARFVKGPLTRLVRYSVRNDLVVMAGATATVMLMFGLVAGGRLPFAFLAPIQGETVTANLTMVPGTPVEQTSHVVRQLEAAALRAGTALAQDLPEDHPDPVRNLYRVVAGRAASGGPGATDAPSASASNVANLVVELPDPEISAFSGEDFEAAWREEIPELVGVRSLAISSSLFSVADPIRVELAGRDPEALRAASADVAEALRSYVGVFDVLTDEDEGEPEYQLELLPEARTLDIALDDLANQVRGAFFGSQVQRLSRDGEEVPVYVRLPESERDAVSDLMDFRVSTPQRTRVPLEQVASVRLGSTPSSINRRDGRRVVSVTADTDPSVVSNNDVTRQLARETVAEIEARYPGVDVILAGEREEQNQAFGSLGSGFGLAALGIFALLAIPLNSYIQPLIIMAAIPFGIIGALLGHALLGVPVGLFTLFGLIGLTGVVVNDSLVFMDFFNTEKERGRGTEASIIAAAQARFRPIMLTSLTTFLGISPLIFERSVQAQFLIPTAVSLGFGILFATPIVMIVVPALIVQDERLGRFLKRRFGRLVPPDAANVEGGGPASPGLRPAPVLARVDAGVAGD